MDSRGRRTWLVRLIMFPAIALAAFAWNQRGADRTTEAAQPNRVVAYSGRTTQGEPMTAVVRNSRLVAFQTHLQCSAKPGWSSAPLRLLWRAGIPELRGDGAPTFNNGSTVWEVSWLPELGPGNTTVKRRRVEQSRVGNAATSTIRASVAGGAVSGSLQTFIVMEWPDGSYGACSATGVRFSLPPHRSG
jgi:hypothetical protein